MSANPLYRHVLLPPVRWVTRHDAETAMDWHLNAMKRAGRSPLLLRAMAARHRPPDRRLAQHLMSGLHFPHPVGIAAGLDKNAAVHPAFEAHHAPGFIEVGTVTLRPQAGNPRPRIVRIGTDELINRMGFPNAGAEAVARNITALPPVAVPLGVNIGKNKDTPDDDAPGEYGAIPRVFHPAGRPLADYYVVNVSSPNTPGLRALQQVERLAQVLDAVTAALDEQTSLAAAPRRRLLVKLAPELAPADVEAVIELVLRYDIGGLILTNTRAAERPGGLSGGLSGTGLYPLSAAAVKRAAAVMPPDRVIVATGGVDCVDRAYEMLRYADLIGVYTGLVLKGPGLLRHLGDGVARRMAADGVGSLAELRAPNRPAAAVQVPGETSGRPPGRPPERT